MLLLLLEGPTTQLEPPWLELLLLLLESHLLLAVHLRLAAHARVGAGALELAVPAA